MQLLMLTKVCNCFLMCAVLSVSLSLSKSITFSKEGRGLKVGGTVTRLGGGGTAHECPPLAPALAAQPVASNTQTHTHGLWQLKQWHLFCRISLFGRPKEKGTGPELSTSLWHHTHAPCGTFTLQCAIMQTHKKRIHTLTHPHTQARYQTLNPLLFSG